ncbi:DUF6777 domain-containing protein [Streptomyces beigongshangae]|uniref:DUF6777 domain-containing protein n=1 Tax=Streptomyces beigongshangae TaxID=2841597 RepID=UPI001C866C7A|nr:DUF6777 domain-containing protein [Streptomyces sp. REN17]
MTIHACPSETGKTVVRRLAVLLAAVLILGGCTTGQRQLAVKAVAAGTPSLAPFFEEDGTLGRDRAEVRSARPHSGLQQGNTPGLYGGTRKQRVCDIDRLKDFLTHPRNKQKAREWARITGIAPDRIGEYIDGLTPVLLRHDTLVKNHDYKKGEAVPYDSLLQAGIAVLVDAQGLPAVKCSCGNPLKSFDGNPERISVGFEDGNKRWSGYDESRVVTVEPAPRPLERIALLDVDDPGTAITRPVGTTGGQDGTFDATAERAVPAVAGQTFGEVSMELSARGLAVAYPGELPPEDARVTGSDPAQGTPLPFGATVTLSVAGSDGTVSGSGTPTDPSSPAEEPGTDPPSPSGPTTDEPPTDVPTKDDPVTGGPTTAGPTTAGPTTGGPATEPTTDDPPTPALSSGTPSTTGSTTAGATSAGPSPVEPTLSGSVPGEPVPPGGTDGGTDRIPV